MTDLDKKRNWFQRLFAVRGMGQVITVFFGLIALCAVFYLINPNFLSERNATNLLRQIAPYLIIGIGQGYVLITGNIDLSIGSVVGMSTMISATLMTHGMDPWLAMLVTIIPCLMTGLLNGFLVSVCKLPPFIGTLGTMTIARGVAQLALGAVELDGRRAEAIGYYRNATEAWAANNNARSSLIELLLMEGRTAEAEALSLAGSTHKPGEVHKLD